MDAVAVTIDGQALVASKRNFKTGSRGFYGNGKVVIDGKAHQVSVSIVEIGSAPKAAKK